MIEKIKRDGEKAQRPTDWIVDILVKQDEIIDHLNTGEVYVTNEEISDSLLEEAKNPDAILRCSNCGGGHITSRLVVGYKIIEEVECKFCNVDGLQVKELTADQAERWMDKGFIVECDRIAYEMFVNHNGKIYYWETTSRDGRLKIRTNGLPNMPGLFYAIIGPAVERKEGLKTWEALKLQEEGWEISDGKYKHRINDSGEYEYFNPGNKTWTEHSSVVYMNQIWTAGRRNYKLPE